jgi:hypothetical protein
MISFQTALTAIAAFGVYFWRLRRRRPLIDRRQATRIGQIWLGMTVLCEFGLGRLVAKKSWKDLLADYNLLRGRTWPLVLLWLRKGPAIIRQWQRRPREHGGWQRQLLAQKVVVIHRAYEPRVASPPNGC